MTAENIASAPYPYAKADAASSAAQSANRTLENLVDERCGAAEEIREVLAVAHQPAGLCIFTKRKHRWDAAPERERGNSLPLSKENRV